MGKKLKYKPYYINESNIFTTTEQSKINCSYNSKITY